MNEANVNYEHQYKLVLRIGGQGKNVFGVEDLFWHIKKENIVPK